MIARIFLTVIGILFCAENFFEGSDFMEERRGKVCLMTFIRPHRSGFALSVVLAIISVASGLVPYFAVAEIVNLLISGEMDFSVYVQWGLIGLIAYFARSVFHGLSTRCSHEATLLKN